MNQRCVPVDEKLDVVHESKEWRPEFGMDIVFFRRHHPTAVHPGQDLQKRRPGISGTASAGNRLHEL